LRDLQTTDDYYTVVKRPSKVAGTKATLIDAIPSSWRALE